jgi:branched-chain amino acid transport system permease protein
MDIVKVVVDALRFAVGAPAAGYALAAIGLNIHYGYTGLLNFGQVAFMLVGAYGTAATVFHGGPLWLGLLVGIVLAVALGLVLGLPTLRLRADYLAIVTIAVAEIARLVTRSPAMEPVTRGVRGIQNFAGDFYALNPIPDGVYGLGRFRFSERALWPIIVGWALVGLATLLVWALMRSPWGRVLRSIREDEDAARSLGKNVFAFKLQSLVLGGVMGALAGMLLALNAGAINPDTYIPALTFFAYVVLIMGGPGRVVGPVVGAVLFWFVIEATDGVLREAVRVGSVTFIDNNDVAALRFSFVGLALMLLMIFRPQGIFGSREEMLVGER